MAISQKRYVDITSTFTREAVSGRDMSGLCLTTSTSITDTQGIVSLDYDGVITKFGANSTEASFAKKYFSYSSKSGTAPKQLKFMKYTAGSEASAVTTACSDMSFATFTFLDTLTAQQAKSIAATNSASNDFRFVIGTTNAATYISSDEDNDLGDNNLFGVKGVTVVEGESAYDCAITMAICAATDYDAANSSTSQMFKNTGVINAHVTTNDKASALDADRVNYVGLVQTYGNQVQFYQRGVNADGTDTACYDNEIWFRSAICGGLLNLMLSVEKVPASPSGCGMINNVVNSVCAQAVTNGVILPGKPLSEAKKQTAISFAGGDATVLKSLELYGYKLTVWIVPDGNEYKAKYRVIYLKGDSVKKIEGAHGIM